MVIKENFAKFVLTMALLKILPEKIFTIINTSPHLNVVLFEYLTLHLKNDTNIQKISKNILEIYNNLM